jgi:malate synthase
MDGAWTGHPDQNAIAVAQFPSPNQLATRHASEARYPDLRPAPTGVGRVTLAGTRAAARTVIRYRNGVLNGKGASLLDGYMEDLATDRIYRLMLAQRVRHAGAVPVADDDGAPVRHDAALLARVFDQEQEALIAALAREKDAGDERTLKEAGRQSRWMIENAAFDPD